MQSITINGSAKSVTFANDKPFSLIAGPCAMETKDHALMMAENLANICDKQGVGFVYKSSFDKANRTSHASIRGVSLNEAISIMAAVRDKIGCPVLTDVHEPYQCQELDGAVDVLQIPAFLCRQTNLLEAAAKTSCVVNVKKGQFLAPHDMRNVVNKLKHFACDKVMITERGVSFGYNTLVTDFRGIVTMAEQNKSPVIFDATHSVQQPGGQGNTSGGQREFAPVLARAAISVGVAGIFAETHQDPDNAPSDGPNMIPLHNMQGFISMLKQYDTISKENNFKLEAL